MKQTDEVKIKALLEACRAARDWAKSRNHKMSGVFSKLESAICVAEDGAIIIRSFDGKSPWIGLIKEPK